MTTEEPAPEVDQAGSSTPSEVWGDRQVGVPVEWTLTPHYLRAMKSHVHSVPPSKCYTCRLIERCRAVLR